MVQVVEVQGNDDSLEEVQSQSWLLTPHDTHCCDKHTQPDSVGTTTGTIVQICFSESGWKNDSRWGLNCRWRYCALQLHILAGLKVANVDADRLAEVMVRLST